VVGPSPSMRLNLRRSVPAAEDTAAAQTVEVALDAGKRFCSSIK